MAIVGARAASPYGAAVARSLAHGLGARGRRRGQRDGHGIDSAAHAGALDAGGATVAVLPGPADRPYPPGRRALHRRLIAAGAAVSELPPGATVRRWMFPARNRIIAALSAMTVVVEAGERSGALLTAGFAAELGRPVGAVPGRSPRRWPPGPMGCSPAERPSSAGAQDVLDALFGAGTRMALRPERPELDAGLAAAAGRDRGRPRHRGSAGAGGLSPTAGWPRSPRSSWRATCGASREVAMR